MPTAYKIIGGDGQEYGPATLDELRSWIVDARVNGQTLVWNSEDVRWRKASQREELQWDLPTALPVMPSVPGLRFVPAGFLLRLAAYCLDFLIVNMAASVLCMPFAPKLRILLEGADPAILGADVVRMLEFYQEAGPLMLLVTGIYSVVSVVYYVCFHGHSGSTPGKRLFGIRVVNADGSALNTRRALVRYGGELLSFLILGFGYLMIVQAPEKRALHDLLANTRVIRREALANP
ncbi:MAG: RDD family protein [Pedosphaera sp.]|nr:RDD family protein [Pedosphaera sp.]